MNTISHGAKMKVFHLPDLGEGLAEAEIREWYVKEGDVVKVDQPLVSMETAKAVVDVPSPYAGKIIKLHGKVNEIVKTDAPLITFETEEGAHDQGSVVGKLESKEGKWEEQEAIIGAPTDRGTKHKAMPAARALAQQLGVDLNQIKGTGADGLITVADVKQHSQGANEATPGMEQLRGVRRAMAQTMVVAHQEVVAVTIVEDANISHLPTDYDLSVLLLQAMAAACKIEPALNAWFDGKLLQRKLFTEINIGLAVDSPEGLLVPVIKQVETQNKATLRQQIDSYKKAARERTLAPAEMQGATITLSNFGSITGRYATPIIVPPTVAILGAGRTRELPVVQDGKVVPGRILPLSLTFDHRAVTGGEATRFLGELIKFIQQAK